MSWRLERIGEQVRGELARLLRDEVSDPRVGLVTLTRVEVAPDLSTASVFWSRLAAPPTSCLPEEEVDADEVAIGDVDRGLKSAAGFLRGRLARELSLRRTPELRFHHDPSLARGAAMLTLIRTLNREREQREARNDPAETDISPSLGAKDDSTKSRRKRVTDE